MGPKQLAASVGRGGTPRWCAVDSARSIRGAATLRRPRGVGAALTGLAVAPELFDTPANVYLGLNQAKASLASARGDADLLDVAAMLWAMAQQIEDGDASQVERDLRAAEQALREALKRGASDDEIKKLMQDLREAARRFAGEMARQAEREGSGPHAFTSVTFATSPTPRPSSCA